jgi:hypothetical protein
MGIRLLSKVRVQTKFNLFSVHLGFYYYIVLIFRIGNLDSYGIWAVNKLEPSCLNLKPGLQNKRCSSLIHSIKQAKLRA